MPITDTITFDDTKVAFASKTDRELKRAYWLFKMISYNILVRMSPPFLMIALKLHLPIKRLIKKTIFAHFCGGENIEDCNKTIAELGKYHVGTILDYSVEGKENDHDFENCVHETLDSIKKAATNKNIPFTVFKVTGLAPFSLLEKINSRESLTESEKLAFEKVKSRVDRICKQAFDLGVRVFVDAEESWIQTAIDNLAEEMMEKYNKEKVIVYNTIQLYRSDRLNYLKESFKVSQEKGYMLGVKLVRGAYMEKERARAGKMGYPSPIQPNKESTDKDYNEALRFCLDHIDKIAICAGTHNENSSLLLVSEMNKRNIASSSEHVYFSQLLGMSDHISYNVAHAGFNVAKYVPYGPVKSVMPYLIRRANENTSIAGQTGRELSLIIKELKRRSKK